MGRDGAATGRAWCRGDEEGDVWTGHDESERGERRGHHKAKERMAGTTEKEIK